jgi:hypothetical protein
MVYVAVSRDNSRSPIDDTSPTGVPLFSHFVEGLAPGEAASITGDDRGHPVRSLRDLPGGEYWMQPFVNVYTRFPRADGHTIWLHNDQWEGQDWKKSPGNLLGDPVRVTFDPKSTAPIRLVANLSRCNDSSAKRLRHASECPVSGQLHPGPFLAGNPFGIWAQRRLRSLLDGGRDAALSCRHTAAPLPVLR